ncbi:G-alpha-domain-containing protein [Phlegmacium glaucopus]|nr:G-alpha-domain-containing protein [Phlegmacium glaucopus]
MATTLSFKGTTSSLHPGHGRFASEPQPRMGQPTAFEITTRIDDELKKESARQKAARKSEVKVMLLGQAESGKSTLQKQFQLYYASKTLDVERLSWIPIVYFNIIKAVRMIFSDLEFEASSTDLQDPMSSADIQRDMSSFRIRLLPLLALESTLTSELNGGVSIGGGRTGAYVRSGWQSLITPNWSIGPESKKPQVDNRIREITNLVARTLASSADDIESLWTHETIRSYVSHRKIRLDESASYFLRSIQRIADVDYSPNNNDILNVRLQTLGVMEHSFPVHMAGRTYNWKLYDVGGARSTWVPYFDDATAIIFLAPISAFDQYLEEDPKTNRIDDSLQLFTSICSNKLLKGAHLVLLLNKIDVLREKLNAGTQIRKYITSFGERPNNFETASDYFRSHFLQVHRRKDVSKRLLYVDVKATHSIISNVGEVIIRKHIAEVGLA